MSKPVYSLDLSPRPNRHVEPRPIIDALDIIGLAVLAGLGVMITMVLFA